MVKAASNAKTIKKSAKGWVRVVFWLRYALPVLSSLSLFFTALFHSVLAYQYGREVSISPVKLLFNSFSKAKTYRSGARSAAADNYYNLLIAGAVIALLLFLITLFLNGFSLYTKWRESHAVSKEKRERASFLYRLIFPRRTSRLLVDLFTPIPAFFVRWFGFISTSTYGSTALYFDYDLPLTFSLALSLLGIVAEIILLITKEGNNKMQEFVLLTEYLEKEDILRANVHVAERCNAKAILGRKEYIDVGNIREPYDFRTPIFEFPRAELERYGMFQLSVTRRKKKDSAFFAGDETLTFEIKFDSDKIIPEEEAKIRADRHPEKEQVIREGEREGLRYEKALYRTENGLPVVVYTMWADLNKVKFRAGTPFGETEFVPYKIQTVEEEAAAATAEGETVLGATNADFFDMFGDCAPSGLCVRAGNTVAGAESPQPFLALTKSGKTGIFYPNEIAIEEVEEAVAGNKILLLDGKIHDVAPLEPFGEIAHPRTAVGIGNHQLIVMVVDGRRPSWSNGSPLCELAKLMKDAGATHAMNLDGGGSSTFLVDDGNGMEMLNCPADLERPNENLIRPLFDSLLLVKNKNVSKWEF